MREVIEDVNEAYSIKKVYDRSGKLVEKQKIMKPTTVRRSSAIGRAPGSSGGHEH